MARSTDFSLLYFKYASIYVYVEKERVFIKVINYNMCIYLYMYKKEII